MSVDASDKECRAAAYHESAHIVTACDLGLPISPKGIYINNFADGRSWFRGATDGIAVSSLEADKVVVALFAGGIAHGRIHGDIQDACKGDDWRITDLLKRHYVDSEACQQKHEHLLGRARETVDQRWCVITRVAEELWSKPWRPKHPHRAWPKEKALSASELAPILEPIAVVIDETVE